MKAKIKIEFETKIEIYQNKRARQCLATIINNIKSHLQFHERGIYYSCKSNINTINLKFSRGHKIRVGQWSKSPKKIIGKINNNI